MVLLLCIGLFGCGGKQQSSSGNTTPTEQGETQNTGKTEEKNKEAEQAEETVKISEDGIYDSKEDVALYIHTYGHLPSNYITKKEAQKLGWQGGDLRPYAPGKCIGGSYFGNNEGLLPDAKGREYHECDIGTLNQKSRGAKRLVYSNDGLIFYTEDHYEHFEQLY
ncbi:MAG: ribonuclease [Firmicutes bacterium]|nr:ribonuclease [Bacillota bacterium]